MAAKKRPKHLSAAALAHLDALLDKALEATFPASDPISVSVDMETSERVVAAPETEDDRLRSSH